MALATSPLCRFFPTHSLPCCLRHVLLMCAVVLVVSNLHPLPGAHAATLQTLEISQLSFANEDGVYAPASSLAELFLVYDAGPVTQHLNVQAKLAGSMEDPVWIVRNLYLHDLSYEPPVAELSRRFSLEELGISSGTELTELLIGYTVTDTPLLDVDFEDWSSSVLVDYEVPVTPRTVVMGTSSLDAGQTTVGGTPPQHGEHTSPALVETNAHRGCTIPNLDLKSTGAGSHPEDWNGCVPAACANSLHWLRGQHRGLINFPAEHREIFDELNRLMNRNPPYKGVDAKTTARAKMDFIEAYGLPIRVKYQAKFDSLNVKSSSGASTAQDQSPSTRWPTKAWLKQEAANGEDVEVNVSWEYTDDQNKTHWDGAHAVVLTGIGTTAGKTWMKFKDDDDQLNNNPRGMRNGESELIAHGDALYAPGLNREVVDKATGKKYPGRAYVSSAVSESYDPTVHAPSSGKYFGKYCESVKRTIPKGGKLEITWPTGVNRGFTATGYITDRRHTPPKQQIKAYWSHNSGKTRTYVNPYPYPVTVEIHNDDKAGDQYPYPGFTVGLRVVGPLDTKNGALAATKTDPSNWAEYGGFSLGADDDSWEEFSPVDLAPSVVVGPIQNEFTLDVVPSHFGETVATQELWINQMVIAWNVYWEHLGLLVDVATLVQPGDLLIECPSTGFVQVVNIPAAGRYEFDLGFMGPAPTFDLRLVAQNGLEMYLDCLGVPSLVPGTITATPPARLAGDAFLGPIHPNPFNPRTTIVFGLPRAGQTSLVLYDLRGRKVRVLYQGFHQAGSFEKIWDGRDESGRPVVSGTYVCRLEAGTEVLSRKLTLVR